MLEFEYNVEYGDTTTGSLDYAADTELTFYETGIPDAGSEGQRKCGM